MSSKIHMSNLKSYFDFFFTTGIPTILYHQANLSQKKQMCVINTK